MNDDYLLLVNKDNVFSEEQLESFKMVDVRDLDGETFQEKETNEQFRALSKYMSKKHKIALSRNSGSRTIQQQQKVMDFFVKRDGEEQAKKRVAAPGTSEHHTGLAIDVGVHKVLIPLEENMYHSPLLVKVINRLNKPTKQEENEMYGILHKELAKFGFILRYPEEKKNETGIEVYEPWHIRYVGVEHAKTMTEMGMCLEEYVKYLKEQELTIG